MADDHAAALRLLQGLVDDPALRARFRADPTAVAEEAGLSRVARELADRPDAPLALEVRESRSGLAGVLMAAAVEGLAIGGLLEHAPDAQASFRAAEDRPPAPAHDRASAYLPRDTAPSTGAAKDQDVFNQSAANVEPAEDDPTSTDPPDDDAPDETKTSADGDEDEDEPDEDEPDEDEPDEDEPDEDEPDEDEDEDDEDEEDDEDDEDQVETEDQDDAEDAGEGGDAGAPQDGAEPPSGDEGASDSGDSDRDDPDDADDDEPDLPDGPQPYPGDEAPKAQRAAWMAAAARDRGLPAELPVMASLVESGLSNLPGGDRDSVGYFQMRTSIWDQGPYAGYADKPERQLDWFLDNAEAVKKQRIARGLAVDDERQYGEWIADVERPAAQYRGRYQEQLDEAQALLRAITDSADAQHEGPRARQALALAQAQLGRPYRWGGSTPEAGFDCSGLVQWAYRKVGIDLPRVTQDQVNAPGGQHIGRRDLLPGDLVFFRDKTGDVHHVGISMGGDRFVHAPHTGDVVHESSLNEPYYRDEFIGGRRFAAAVTTDRSHDVQRLAAVKRPPAR
jgi:cell wall-associated NlpC family hydrolase